VLRANKRECEARRAEKDTTTQDDLKRRPGTDAEDKINKVPKGEYTEELYRASEKTRMPDAKGRRVKCMSQKKILGGNRK